MSHTPPPPPSLDDLSMAAVPLLHCDIAIIGAGPVGLALANWLLRESPWQIALIDAKSPEQSRHDPRAIAVSQGSRTLLEPLGAWPTTGTPIHTIHVSQRGHFGRTVIRHEDYGLPALGYVLPYGALVTALAEALRRHAHTTPAAAKRLHWLTHAPVTQLDAPAGQPVSLQLQTNAQTTGLPDSPSGQTNIVARYVVHAEGGLFHQQTAHAQTGGKTRDYGQTALLATVACNAPLAHWAWERFTPEGPLALLPQSRLHNGQPVHEYALVWCSSTANASARMALDDAAFLHALEQAFGSRLGRFIHASPRHAIPLGLNAVAQQVQGRLIAIGNAAQTLHPVAGQGFNLGLRDAHTLAHALRDSLSEISLQAFARRRRADRFATIGLTDFLPRIFAGNFGPLAHARGAALAALELLPPLKHALAKQMMAGQRH